jgi:alkaline phosphatase D
MSERPGAISRRAFLARAAAGAAIVVQGGLAAGQPGPPSPSGPVPRFAADPFTLGVASGYPEADSVVLWTRLAPAPLQPDGGMPAEAVPVRWEMAADERMGRVVRQGIATADAAGAHSVHVVAQGLEPGRWYWYRFGAGEATSPIGRTRTAPPPGPVDRLSFAFASCQHYEQGYFTAYRHVIAEDPDLVVFLGDYIYESSWGRNHVRAHGGGEPMTLAEYRVRHARYRTDPDLQAAHAAVPWVLTWDDHEVVNDYANDRGPVLVPPAQFLARRAAAYRAYYEHLPLPPQMAPDGPHARLHTRLAWGDLARFHVLDDRQYRSHQACPRPGRGGSSVVLADECPALQEPSRTMLGAEQEHWLLDGLDRSPARWNVIAQQTLMAQLDRLPGPGQRFWTDGWDGYPVARRRLLDHLRRARAANPLVVSGDVHSFWVADLKADFDDPASPTVATEVVGSSITSQFGRSQLEVDLAVGENPHMRFATGARRGYAHVVITPARCEVALRGMTSVATRAGRVETVARFVIDDGRAGAQQA